MKNLNKNISVWQGENTPASTTSLWLKEDGLYVYNNQWVKTSPIDFETEVDDKISKVKEEINEKVGEAASEINTKLEGKLDKLENYLIDMSYMADNYYFHGYKDNKSHTYIIGPATEARAGIMTHFDKIKLNKSIYDLGDFNKSLEAELQIALQNIGLNQNITIIRYTVQGNGPYVVIQSLNGNTTTQLLMLKGLFYFRDVTYNSDKSVNNIGSWNSTMADALGYNSQQHRYELYSKGKKLSGNMAPIPEGTTGTLGLVDPSKFTMESTSSSSGFKFNLKYNGADTLASITIPVATYESNGLIDKYFYAKYFFQCQVEPIEYYINHIYDWIGSPEINSCPIRLGAYEIAAEGKECAWVLTYNIDNVKSILYINQSGLPEFHRKSQWVDEKVHWATKISYDSSTRSIKLISDQEEMSSDSIPEATQDTPGLINYENLIILGSASINSRNINMWISDKTGKYLGQPFILLFDAYYFNITSSGSSQANITLNTSRLVSYSDINYLQLQITGHNTAISELQTNLLHYSNLINTNTTNISKLDSNVAEITKALGDYDKKIFSDKYWHTNGFIRKSNGNLAELPTLPQWNYTDFIEVSENELVSISLKSNTDDVAVIACYDKDKNYLSSKSISTSSGEESWNKQYNYTLTVDSEIKYIRCSCNTSLNSSKDITITKSTDTISDRIISLENTVSEATNSTVSLTYLTPEDYGAKGDLATDDTTALNKCIADAITKGKAVKALNKYLVSDTITITGNKLDIEINEIKGTSTSNPTIKYDGGDSVIKINTLTSNYIGLELNTTTNKCIENTFNINKIDALHCIVYHIVNKAAFGNIFHFNCLSGKHKSWSTGYPVANENSYGITDLLYGDIPSSLYVSENSYYGGMIYNFSWAFYGTGNNNKFYNWGFENPFGGGWNFVNEFYCQIYADRHTEVVKDNEGAKLIKLTSTTKDDKNRYYVAHGSANSEGLYYKSTQVIYPDNIDLSEAPIYSKVEGNKVLYLTNSSQSTIDCRMQANLISSGTYSHLTNKFYIVGNLLILSPDLKVWKEVTTDTLDLRTLSKESKKFPTTFEVKTNTNIYLHSSYCFFGYSDFDIIQRDSAKAKVYDYNGNLIWDGTSKDAGTYHFAHRAYGETNYNVFINGYGAKWFVNDELQALSWYPTTGEIS